MTSTFAVVDSGSRSFHSFGAVLAYPSSNRCSEINGFLIRIMPFSRSCMVFDELLRSRHGHMQDAPPLPVVVVSDYMLPLPSLVDLRGEPVHLAEAVVPRAAGSREAPAIEFRHSGHFPRGRLGRGKRIA